MRIEGDSFESAPRTSVWFVSTALGLYPQHKHLQSLHPQHVARRRANLSPPIPPSARKKIADLHIPFALVRCAGRISKAPQQVRTRLPSTSVPFRRAGDDLYALTAPLPRGLKELSVVNPLAPPSHAAPGLGTRAKGICRNRRFPVIRDRRFFCKEMDRKVHL